MAQQISKSGLNSPILEQVREKMAVYDLGGEKIGTVADVYLGSVSDMADTRGEGSAVAYEPDIPGKGSLAADIAGVFSSDDELPDVLRSRLLRHGFIRIDSAGLFAVDCYAMPDQIASVSGDRIDLNVLQDELIEK